MQQCKFQKCRDIAFIYCRNKNDWIWSTNRTRSKAFEIFWKFSYGKKWKRRFHNHSQMIALMLSFLNSRISYYFENILIHQTIDPDRQNWLWQDVWMKRNGLNLMKLCNQYFSIHKQNTRRNSNRQNLDDFEREWTTFALFTIYFEIKCQYYLQYFQSSIDWYSYSLFKIRNWLFHFCFRFLQRFIRLYRNTKILNQESRKFRLFSKRFRFESK